MTNPELKVEMRLLTDKVMADAARAQKLIAKQMESTAGAISGFEFPSDKKARLARLAQLKKEEKEQSSIDMRRYREQDRQNDKIAKDGIQNAIAASRTNILLANKAAKDAERQAIAASRLNISMREKAEKLSQKQRLEELKEREKQLKQQDKEKKQADSQAVAASRLNIQMRKKAVIDEKND